MCSVKTSCICFLPLLFLLLLFFFSTLFSPSFPPFTSFLCKLWPYTLGFKIKTQFLPLISHWMFYLNILRKEVWASLGSSQPAFPEVIGCSILPVAVVAKPRIVLYYALSITPHRNSVRKQYRLSLRNLFRIPPLPTTSRVTISSLMHHHSLLTVFYYLVFLTTNTVFHLLSYFVNCLLLLSHLARKLLRAGYSSVYPAAPAAPGSRRIGT